MKTKQYNDIGQNIMDIHQRITAAAERVGRDPKTIQLMAVTKTVDAEIVNMAIDQGIILLGENRAQELLHKVDDYQTERAEIHFIGALQTNKVKQIIDHVSMIQSVDRLALAEEINRQGEMRGRVMDILIQVNVGKEETKSGVFPEDTLSFAKEITKFPYLNCRGIMSIPPICNEKQKIIEYFDVLRQQLVDISRQNRDNRTINILSMGMSDDFEIAIEHGATLVRIGSALFGSRS